MWKKGKLKCEMIWKISKKGKLNSGKILENTEENIEMIWKIWKKSKLNREQIWKMQEKGKSNSEKIGNYERKIRGIVKRFGKCRRQL